MVKLFNEDKHFDISSCLIKKQAFFDEIDFSQTDSSKINEILHSEIEYIEFYKCIFKDLNLENESFSDKISFSECMFKGNTKFSGSTFDGDISFVGSTFDGITEFNNVYFNKNSDFSNILAKPAKGYFYFRGDQKEQQRGYYNNKMKFNKAKFECEVSFFGQNFTDQVSFNDVTFMNKFWFTNAELGMKSSFKRINFECSGIKDIENCFRIFRERLESSHHKFDAEKVLEFERKLHEKAEDPKGIMPTNKNETKVVNSNLLDTKEAAEYLHLKPNTLEVWRSQDPDKVKFVKIGGKIRYRLEDLQEFISKS